MADISASLAGEDLAVFVVPYGNFSESLDSCSFYSPAQYLRGVGLHLFLSPRNRTSRLRGIPFSGSSDYA